eukprot:10202405-Heterocapsa_arctica.AAC.1
MGLPFWLANGAANELEDMYKHSLNPEIPEEAQDKHEPLKYRKSNMSDNMEQDKEQNEEDKYPGVSIGKQVRLRA